MVWCCHAAWIVICEKGTYINHAMIQIIHVPDKNLDVESYRSKPRTSFSMTL